MRKKACKREQDFSSQEIVYRLFDLGESYLYGDKYKKFISLLYRPEKGSNAENLAKIKIDLVSERDKAEKLCNKKFGEFFLGGIDYVMCISKLVRHHALRDPLVIDFISACVRFIETTRADADIKKKVHDTLKSIYENATPDLRKNKTSRVLPMTIAVEYREIEKRARDYKGMSKKSRVALVKEYCPDMSDDDILNLLINSNSSKYSLALDILSYRHSPIDTSTIRDLLTKGNKELEFQAAVAAKAREFLRLRPTR